MANSGAVIAGLYPRELRGLLDDRGNWLMSIWSRATRLLERPRR
jgi:hypothetical protein